MRCWPRFSGTLANVSSIKARPLVTKTGYLLCYIIMYHTQGLNIIYHDRAPFHILQQDTLGVVERGGGGGEQRIFIEYDVGQKKARNRMLNPRAVEKLLTIHLLSLYIRSFNCLLRRLPLS